MDSIDNLINSVVMLKMLTILGLFSNGCKPTVPNIMNLFKLEGISQNFSQSRIPSQCPPRSSDIDSTIEDSQHNDLIKLSKYRTINLRDNPRAFTEMARAHLRFTRLMQ